MNQNQDNAELFVNCLEAMVETCLPGGDDLEVQTYPSSLGISSNLNLSSSMSSLSVGSLHSPTDKESGGQGDLGGTGSIGGVCGNGGATRTRHGSASLSRHRLDSFKRSNSNGKKTQPATDSFEWECTGCMAGLSSTSPLHPITGVLWNRRGGWKLCELSQCVDILFVCL